MLDARDRKRLTPKIEKLRAADAVLAGARQRLAEVDAELVDATARSDWRDRRLGGLFSENSAVAKQYRDARREHRKLTAKVAEHEAAAESAALAVDNELEPILNRRDQGFRQLTQALDDCEAALRECRTVADLLATASRSVGSVLKGMTGNPSRSTVETAAELAAGRYEDAVRRVRTALPKLDRVVGTAHRAVVQVTRTSVKQPPAPSLGLLKRLPAGASGVSERYRMRNAEVPLRDLRKQVDTLVEAVTRWNGVLDTARRRKLRAAHSLL